MWISLYVITTAAIKTLKKSGSHEHGSKPGSKVHKPCLAVKYTSLIRQVLYTLV